MSPLVAELDRQLEDALARLEGRVAGLSRKRADLSSVVERRIVELDDVRERRAIESLDVLHARVVDRVRAGQLEALSPREARAGARMLAALGPESIEGLLSARPEVWPAFVDEIFRTWELLDALPSRNAFTRLAARAPASLQPLDHRSREKLLAPTGPRWVSERALKATLVDTHATMTRLGFRPRWTFTAQALAHAAGMVADRSGLDAVWRELETAPYLAGTLLPPVARTNGRWFFAKAALHQQGSTIARALFAAEVLRGLQARKLPFEDRFVAAILDSEFADPRIPPETRGWQLVRHFDRTAYARFVEGLIREDLTLFFQHAMNEPARRTFWLRYLGSIRRTICVLGSGMYKTLAARLKASDDDTRAALGRVRRFSAHHGVSAFCLYFDDIVVVEFSDSGNAAYVYRRAAFDAELEGPLMGNRLRAHDDLKQPHRTIHRIHHRRGWEGDTHDFLVRHGIRRT